MNPNNNKLKLNYSTLWHLWHGYNRLTIPTRIAISRAVLVLDVSKWQGNIDFAKMKAEGVDGVIIKCGQGGAQDPYFDQNWRNARAAGLPRGSYWFWDSRYPARTQAENWWEWVKSDVGELGHYGDYEESYGGNYGGWQNFKNLLDYFGNISRLPITCRGMYTGYYYFIAHSPTSPTELAAFREYPLWLAWYTNNPDYVKIPRPWTESELTFWQYGTPTNGARYGTQSLEIDENNFNGDEWAYKQRFGLSGDVVLPPIPPLNAAPGIEYRKLRRFESDCHMVVVDLAGKRVHVTDTHGQLRTVSSVARERGAEVAINGDGWWLNPIRPLSIAASDGARYQETQYDFRYLVNVSRDNRVTFAWKDWGELYNAVSGTRLIVDMGAWTGATDGKRDPRTAAGATSDGRLVLAVVDGRSAASAGATLQELASLLIEFGAVTGLELDGGGSSAMWVADRIVNIPSDGAERAVVNHLVITGETSMAKNKVTVTWDGGCRERKSPSIYETIVGSLLADNTVHYSDLDPVPDQDDPTNPDKQWILLQSGYYIAVRYPSSSGIVERARVESVLITPPPADIYLTHTIEVYSDGSIKVDGNAVA